MMKLIGKGIGGVHVLFQKILKFDYAGKIIVRKHSSLLVVAEEDCITNEERTYFSCLLPKEYKNKSLFVRVIISEKEEPE